MAETASRAISAVSAQQKVLELVLHPDTYETVAAGLLAMAKAQTRLLQTVRAIRMSPVYSALVFVLRAVCLTIIAVYSMFNGYFFTPLLKLSGFNRTKITTEAHDSDSKECTFSLVKQALKEEQMGEEFMPRIKELREGYEAQTFEGGYWITTQITGRMRHNTGVREGTMRLLQYSEGANASRAVYEACSPIVTQVSGVDNHQFDFVYTVSMCLPKFLQDRPPAPTCPDVILVERPNTSVFSRSFSGFTTNERWITETENLLRILAERGDFNTSHYYTVIHGSPFKLQHEHNEIWFERKSPNNIRATDAKRITSWVSETAGFLYRNALPTIRS